MRNCKFENRVTDVDFIKIIVNTFRDEENFDFIPPESIVIDELFKFYILCDCFVRKTI